MLLTAWIAGVTLAQDSDGGVIEGRVVNGTNPMGNVTGLDITATMFVGMEAIGSASTKSNGSGAFRFENLPASPDSLYFVTAEYQDVGYHSEALTLAGNGSIAGVEIEVYESTDSDNAIAFTLVHPAIKVTGEGIVVSQYYQYANHGNLTYIGTPIESMPHGRGTLRFWVPGNATDVGGDERLILVGNELIDTLPLIPGNGELAYNYILPTPEDGDLDFSLVLTQPAETVRVTVSGEGITVSETGGLAEHTIAVGDTDLTVLTGSDMEKSSVVEITLTGFPEGGLGGWLYVIVVAGAHAVGLTALLFVRRMQGAKAAARLANAQSEKERLLQEIAALDDAFERGAVSEESYNEMRAEKKGRLVDLMRRTGSRD
jgi:hypothetical protein